MDDFVALIYNIVEVDIVGEGRRRTKPFVQFFLIGCFAGFTFSSLCAVFLSFFLLFVMAKQTLVFRPKNKNRFSYTKYTGSSQMPFSLRL